LFIAVFLGFEYKATIISTSGKPQFACMLLLKALSDKSELEYSIF